jgi:hypothetical protein
MSWAGSLSPGVCKYRVYRATNVIDPVWQRYGETTIDEFVVDITNGPQAFYTVRAVNNYGLESQ